VNERSVVNILTVVDFPAPFGPRKPKTSPASTRRSTPLTASTVPVRLLYVFTTPLASTAAAGSRAAGGAGATDDSVTLSPLSLA